MKRLAFFLLIGQLAFAAHSVSVTCTDSPDKAANPTLAYNFYRGTATGGPYVLQTSSPVSACSFTDNGVQVGQTYFYVATSVLNGNESVNSNESPARILPSPPSNVKAVAQ